MSFPADYNFNYYVGDTKEFVIHPKNRDGTAFDLAGYTATMVISTELATSAETDWSTEATVAMNATDGYIHCTIAPEIGNTLAEQTKYFYDVEIRKSVGGQEIVHTLLKGVITPVMGVNKKL